MSPALCTLITSSLEQLGKKKSVMVILCVDLAMLRCQDSWSKSSVDVAVKVQLTFPSGDSEESRLVSIRLVGLIS